MYDALYRLSTAVTPGSTNYPAWGLQENYDRYGNRLSQAAISGCTGQTCPQPSVLVDGTTNRITGSPYTFDANGNMTNDGINSITYDAENHAVSSSGTLGSGTYTIDGHWLRVNKVSGSTTTVYIFSGSKVIAEYDNGAGVTSPSREYVYGGSALLAKIDSSGTKYYHQDHLSNRLVTNSTGNTSAQMGHFPFGESWYNATNDKLFFTSYERDAESGNDYAQARYYISRLARFSGPDPIPGSTGDPQSLNRYAYAHNLPTLMVDPTGMDPCDQAMYDARRHKRQPFFNSSGRGLLDDEIDAAFGLQDPGVDCVDGGGSSDPPLDPGPGSDLEVIAGQPDNLQPIDTVEVTATPDSFDQVDWINPTLLPSANSLFGKASVKTLQLITKPDCMNFLIGVQRAAMSAAYGGLSNSVQQQWASALSTNFNPVTNQMNLNAAPLVQDSAAPSTNGYTTIAEVQGAFIPGSTVTLFTYQGFSSGGTLYQAQVLIHEAMHANAGVTDQQVAAAAGVQNGLSMSTGQASNEFMKKLQAKCK